MTVNLWLPCAEEIWVETHKHKTHSEDRACRSFTFSGLLTACPAGSCLRHISEPGGPSTPLYMLWLLLLLRLLFWP